MKDFFPEDMYILILSNFIDHTFGSNLDILKKDLLNKKKAVEQISTNEFYLSLCTKMTEVPSQALTNIHFRKKHEKSTIDSRKYK